MRFLAVLVLVLGLSVGAAADEEKMPLAKSYHFAFEDPAGDDVGDGDYVYPTDAAFGDGGEADILLFHMGWTETDILFSFKMKNLVDPWNVGNRLTMVAVAIDTKEGGDKELRHNANAFLKAPSEFQIFAGGGTAEMIDAAGEKVAAPIKSDANTETNTITVSVPVSAIGMPEMTWKLTVAAGLQDDFGAGGLGDFRGVNAKAEQWRGGGGDDLAIDSNIYDLILPKDTKPEAQAKILGDYSLEKAKFVELPFIGVDVDVIHSHDRIEEKVDTKAKEEVKKAQETKGE